MVLKGFNRSFPNFISTRKVFKIQKPRDRPHLALAFGDEKGDSHGEATDPERLQKAYSAQSGGGHGADEEGEKRPPAPGEEEHDEAERPGEDPHPPGKARHPYREEDPYRPGKA